MRRSALFLALLLSSSPLFAQEKSAAEAFGKREGVEDISLSPDGTKVAYIAPTAGQGNRLFTADLARSQPPQGVVSASGDPERLHNCEWVSNERLICLIYAVSKASGDRYDLSRLIAVNADGSNLKLLSKRQNSNALWFSYFGGEVIDLLPGDDGAVLLGRQYIPDTTVGTRLSQDETGYGVDRIDTNKLSSKRVVKPSSMATEYISDGEGNVRTMALMIPDNGYDSGRRLFQYRGPTEGSWEQLSEYDSAREIGFRPVAVDPVENVAYGYEKLDGRFALYKVKLESGLAKTLVYSRPDVDIDNLLMLGRRKKVAGLSFATEKRQAVYFDPAFDKLSKALAKALPDAAMISFGGLSADGNKIIVGAFSDTNPGQYYLFDKATGTVNPLLAARAELEAFKLAPVKAVTVKAADGTDIPAYLTLPVGSSGKGLPAIVMPHGGPSARDEWGFDWLAQFYASRGFAVLQPNYRGSSGYGDSWYQKNGFQSWKLAVGDVNDSGRWLVSQGIADPAKLAIVGWSYGGYAALQSAVLDPDLYKAIVAVAPVTDLAKLKDDRQIYTDYKIVRDFIGSGPHVAEGSPARNASSFKAPVMLFHGDLDLNVSIMQSRFMEDQLKSAGKAVNIVIYPKLDHQLADSAARADLLAKSEAFLRKTMGMADAP